MSTSPASRTTAAPASAAGRRERRTLVDDVKQLILDEKLRPGDPLPTEVELVERLGVSRPHLREALRTLQSLDIVSIQHGRGMRVGALSLAPMIESLLFRARIAEGEPLRVIDEVVDLRERLDLSVAAELCENGLGDLAEPLRRTVEEMGEVHAAGESFADEDRRFHSLLLSRAGNELFGQVNAAFWEIHSQAVPLLGIAPARNMTDTVHAHAAILDAIEERDADAYRAAVRAHYQPLLRQLGRGRDEERA